LGLRNANRKYQQKADDPSFSHFAFVIGIPFSIPYWRHTTNLLLSSDLETPLGNLSDSLESTRIPIPPCLPFSSFSIFVRLQRVATSPNTSTATSSRRPLSNASTLTRRSVNSCARSGSSTRSVLFSAFSFSVLLHYSHTLRLSRNRHQVDLEASLVLARNRHPTWMAQKSLMVEDAAAVASSPKKASLPTSVHISCYPPLSLPPTHQLYIFGIFARRKGSS